MTAPGRGNLPVIRVYNQTGTLLTQFQAYPSSVNGGLQIALADVDGDGLKDIITVPSWGSAEVRVFRNLGIVNGVPTFDGAHPYRDFLAFPSSFIGGASWPRPTWEARRTNRSSIRRTAKRRSSSEAAPA